MEKDEKKIEEDAMLKTMKNSFKKNMVILVCVAFICMSFPGVTHAATKPSSAKLPFPKEFLSLFSPVFSLLNLNSPLAVYDLATVYKLSINGKNPSKKNQKNHKNQKNKKDKNSYGNRGDSTSKKPANGKD